MLYVLTHPELWEYGLKGLYLPVVIEYLWLKEYNINTIIDVGAHKGEEIKYLNYLFPKAKIYIFEPLPFYASYLKDNYGKLATIIEKAVSDKQGQVDFFENSFSPASSLLEISVESKKKYKLISKAKKVRVESTTLDKELENADLRPDVFMKLDIQGAEGLAIKYGTKILKQVSVLFIEIAFEGHYKGQEEFASIYDRLIKLDFKFKGIQPDGIFEPQFMLPKRVNCVFVNNRISKLI